MYRQCIRSFGAYRRPMFYPRTSEENHLDSLQKLVPGLQIDPNPFAPFDYKKGNTFVELKGRTNTLQKYKTTLIGHNKVMIAYDNPKNTYYFAFAFTNGLYYIQFFPCVFDTFRIDTNLNHKLCYHIPIQTLSRLE
jgi:hypothetical protein